MFKLACSTYFLIGMERCLAGTFCEIFGLAVRPSFSTLQVNASGTGRSALGPQVVHRVRRQKGCGHRGQIRVPLSLPDGTRFA